MSDIKVETIEVSKKEIAKKLRDPEFLTNLIFTIIIKKT